MKWSSGPFQATNAASLGEQPDDTESRAGENPRGFLLSVLEKKLE